MHHTVNADCPGHRTGLRGRRRIHPSWVLVLAVAVASCGYQLDGPRLPNNASRLSIATVKNETTTGELDIRLQQLLRSRMLRHTSFDLVAAEGSDMSLEV